MPELPEVETIAGRLRNGGPNHPSLIDRAILGTQLLWERTLAMPAPSEFETRIVDQIVSNINRRGKYLVFELSPDFLLFHLRMSGDIVVEDITGSVDKHHRLTLDLEGGLRLAFNDTRKFGRVWLTADPESILGSLGPEPLDDSLNVFEFHHRMQSHRRQLKPLLLDQHFIAGLGNIYTDEALNLAQLHPKTRSDRLTFEQSRSLLSSIRKVLNGGIRRNGTSIDWAYKGGDNQKYLRVYQRTGKPCPRCGTPIQRIVVGQRGTHLCPNCQQLNN
jgi:formamidopyrimidine-DNA glycosylase